MTDVVENPVLRLTFDLSNAGRWDSEHKDTGKVRHNYQWSQEQWRHIETVAFKLLLVTMNGSAPWAVWNDAITPEALDYWEEDLPEDLFKSSDALDENEHLNGCTTAIGMVDSILQQFEEEIGKRGGSLP